MIERPIEGETERSRRSSGRLIWISLLIVFSSLPACQRSPASDQSSSKQDEFDLQTLRDAFQLQSPELKKSEEQLVKNRDSLHGLRLPDARLQSEWIVYRDQLTQCADLVLEIEKAGNNERYAEIPSLAIQGVATSNKMIADIETRSKKAIQEMKKHSAAPKTSVLESQTRRLSFYNTLLKTAGQFRNEAFFRILNLVLLSGPRKMRLTTFESIGQEYAREQGENNPAVLRPLESVMQGALEKERDSGNKARMEIVMNQLNVPLVAPKQAGDSPTPK